MDAAVVEDCRVDACHVGVLKYPMAVIRVTGASTGSMRRVGWRVVRNWKSGDPGRNTVNLVLVNEKTGMRPFIRRTAVGQTAAGQTPVLYIFLRNPDYRTPSSLLPLKREGVGVIEAAGEAILPVPESPALWEKIWKDGLSVIKGIIEGNSPIKPGDRHRITEVIG